MTKEQTKLAYPWLGGTAARLVERGWDYAPYWLRDNPTHTAELRTRVDALAASIRRRGKRDPWGNAFGHVCMMLKNPDWWKEHCPAQVAIIDPPTLPPVVSETVFLKEGFLPLYWSEITHYKKLSADERGV